MCIRDRTNSLRNVAEGNTDIAAVPMILPFLLQKNLGPYSTLEDGKGAELVTNVRLLYPYNFSAHALWGFETAGITSYDQLEGKTILNGPPAGAALTSARNYITAITGLEEGKGYTGLQVNWGQMDTAAMDGSADINMLPTGFPESTITAASSAGSVVIISIPKDIFESEQFQRIASAARFLSNAALLPVKLTNSPVCSRVTTLGYRRPGELVPYRHYVQINPNGERRYPNTLPRNYSQRR